MSNENTTPAVISKSNAIVGVPIYEDPIGHEARVILKALQEGVLVSALNDYRLTESLNVAITAAYLMLKRQMPDAEDKDFLFMKLQIVKRIRNKRYNIRDTEILIAFENGIHGEYGEYYGLTAVSFSMFIAAYCDQSNTNRTAALAQLNAPKEMAKVIPSRQKQFEIAKENALTGYRLFLKDTRTDESGRVVFGTTGHFGSVIFNFLYEIRVFLITQEEIDDVLKRAASVYMAQLKQKAAAQTDTLRRKEVESVISKFMGSIESNTANPGEADPMLWATAKQVYIDDIFAGYYMEELTDEALGEMINSNYKYYEAKE